MLLRYAVRFVFAILPLYLGASTGIAVPVNFRTFQSTDDRFIVARVLELNGETVVIEREDGEEFTLPVSRLSQRDRAYLRQLDVTTDWLNAFWERPLQREQWTLISSEGEEVLRLKHSPLLFGDFPLIVDVWVKEDRPVRLQATFIEVGRFFRTRTLDRANRSRMSAAERRVAQNRQRQGRRQDQVDRRTFPVEFRRLEREIPAAIEAVAGDRLRTRGEGAGLLRTQVRSVSVNGVGVQLFVESEQLIMVAIQPREGAPAAVAATQGQRQEVRQERVERLPNGDVLIHGLPMIAQGGRSYCAVGTLAMISAYHGLSLDIDRLAAQAGYREGDVDNAAILPLYEEVARQGRLKLSSGRLLNIREVCRELEQGRPVLVWRFISPPRDNFHSAFARRFAADPALILPHPNRGSEGREDRRAWPTEDDFRHASIINGFNKERGEFIFSESWSEAARNRRMRFEEMEATAYWVCLFR